MLLSFVRCFWFNPCSSMLYSFCTTDHSSVNMKVLTLTIMAIATTAQASAVFDDSARGSDSELSLRRLPALVRLPPRRVDLVQRKKKKEHKKPEEVIPKCALPCIEPYILKHTMCELDNWKCICKHHEVKDADASACLVNNCGMTNTKSMFLPRIHDLESQIR